MHAYRTGQDITVLNDHLEVPGIGFIPANAFVLHAREPVVVDTGVVSQQLANTPHESFDQGRFTAALPGLVSMFARYYQPPATSASRGRHHADKD